MSEKRKALIAQREMLINEIKYYGKKVDETRSVATIRSQDNDGDSSSSECEFSVDISPSITELKLTQRLLQTCLHATQELTGVTVLESEVNILVDDANFNVPRLDAGVWREVTAECRMHHVPFTINFYIHKPTCMYGASSYRNMTVTPVKAAHETELSHSVLPNLTRPSDAIETLRNYATAHRSRRTTLAHLAETYTGTVYMQPMTIGGYVLKCVDLLEVQWTLQNKWSPIVPFHHRMKFDLEYMDEAYIKIITHLHRQIIDPSIETDERTLLLAKIISTCIEAKAPIEEQSESTESEVETAKKLISRRTTLDQEPEAPGQRKKDDSVVMAPPKALPKKSRNKDKANTPDDKSKAAKRSLDVQEADKTKKTKTVDAKTSESKTSNKTSRTDNVNKNIQKNVVSNDVNNKTNIENNTIDKKQKASEDKPEKSKLKKSSNLKINNDNFKNNAKQQSKQELSVDLKNVNKLSNNVDLNLDISKDPDKNSSNNNNVKVNGNKIQNTKYMNTKNTKTKVTTNKESTSQNAEMDRNIHKKVKEIETVKYNKSKELPEKVPVPNKKRKVNNPETVGNSSIQEQKAKANNQGKIKGNQNEVQTLTQKNEVLKENINNEQRIKEKSTSKQVLVEKSNKEERIKGNPYNDIIKDKKSGHVNSKIKERIVLSKHDNLTKNINDGTSKTNTVNYIKNQFNSKKLKDATRTKEAQTKIPTKKMSINEKFKNNPLRISPRKPPTTLKPGVHEVSKGSQSSQISLQKFTNIPRLVKKPQGVKSK